MEIERISNKNLGSVFKPLQVQEYSLVQNELNSRALTEETELILLDIGSKQLAFSKHKMAFHHIAQGRIDESPFMLTFCVICNSGMVMNPVVDGEMLHFSIAGAYNGMLLMTDTETGSYWDHITGLCLHGSLKDKQLELLGSHQILTLKELLALYPDCLYGKENVNFIQKLFAKFANWKANVSGKGFLPPGFRSSMKDVDDRLPEMEMGLGIWVDGTSHFYPLKSIKENGGFSFDQLNGRQVFIYISPTTHAPTPIYLDNTDDPKFKGDKVTFSNGTFLQSGNLFSVEGKMLQCDKPNHLFLRWYGFVSTFPECEVKTTLQHQL